MTRYERIKQLCKDNNLTITGVEKDLGFARGSLCKIDKSEPRMEKVLRLSEKLKTTPDYIMYGTPYVTTVDDRILSAADIEIRDSFEATMKALGKVLDISTPQTRIKVLGSVPAGIPIEAIEDIVDWEEIPREWTLSGKEYFGLKVKGDSMSPEYLDGDTIILQKTNDCESGDDCVVYVNGYDATFKRVIKKTDHIILQPINSTYEPIMCEYTGDNSVQIAGVVVELRRKKRR